MSNDEREEIIIKMMVLTQRLNQWTLKMNLKLIQEKSKQVRYCILKNLEDKG